MSNRIDGNMPVEVLKALAEGCGFTISYDRAPNTDEWRISTGHGDSYRWFVGTKQEICAFLTGYAEMSLQTTQILNELDNAHRRLILEMRSRYGAR